VYNSINIQHASPMLKPEILIKENALFLFRFLIAILK